MKEMNKVHRNRGFPWWDKDHSQQMDILKEMETKKVNFQCGKHEMTLNLPYLGGFSMCLNCPYMLQCLINSRTARTTE